MYARATARTKRANFFYGERVAEPEIVTGRGNGERTVSKTLVNQDGLLDLNSRRQLKEFLETKVVSSLVRDLSSSDSSSNDDEEEILLVLSEMVTPTRQIFGSRVI